MGRLYTYLAECCLGWGHLFLYLSELFIDLGRRAEMDDL